MGNPNTLRTRFDYNNSVIGTSSLVEPNLLQAPDVGRASTMAASLIIKRVYGALEAASSKDDTVHMPIFPPAGDDVLSEVVQGEVEDLCDERLQKYFQTACDGPRGRVVIDGTVESGEPVVRTHYLFISSGNVAAHVTRSVRRSAAYEDARPLQVSYELDGGMDSGQVWEVLKPSFLPE